MHANDGTLTQLLESPLNLSYFAFLSSASFQLQLPLVCLILVCCFVVDETRQLVSHRMFQSHSLMAFEDNRRSFTRFLFN